MKDIVELDEIKNKQAIEQINKFLADKDNHKALAAVNNLLDKEPTNENAWLYLGIVNRRMGKLDVAIKSFETATELDNTYIEAWGLLTITYMDKGDHQKAKKARGETGKSEGKGGQAREVTFSRTGICFNREAGILFPFRSGSENKGLGWQSQLRCHQKDLLCGGRRRPRLQVD